MSNGEKLNKIRERRISVDLKPCPVCGGKAVFKTFSYFTNHQESGIEFFIKCGNPECWAIMPQKGKVNFILDSNGELILQHDDRESLASKWNKPRTVSGQTEGQQEG